MKKDTILCFLLVSCFLFYSHFQPILASCPQVDGKIQLNLSVHVPSLNNYTVSDEPVKIRHYDNKTSLIIAENLTDAEANAHFCLEAGNYWVDVRNVWVPLTLATNQTFIFPYSLFKNESNTSKISPGESFPDLPIPIIILGGIVVFGVIIIIAAAISVKKNEKERQRALDEDRKS